MRGLCVLQRGKEGKADERRQTWRGNSPARDIPSVRWYDITRALCVSKNECRDDVIISGSPSPGLLLPFSVKSVSGFSFEEHQPNKVYDLYCGALSLTLDARGCPLKKKEKQFLDATAVPCFFQLCSRQLLPETM